MPEAPAPEQAAPEAAQPTEPVDTTDYKAEYEKLQREARKWEERAKSNSTAAKELEQLRQQSMTEQERAVEAAKAEARSQAFTEIGGRLVEAAVQVAAAGRLDDDAVTMLLQGLDRSKFLDENGEVDKKSVAAFVDGIAPKSTQPEQPGFPDLGQGARGQTVTGGPAQDFAKFISGQLNS